ncbi:hypothetical protein [Actinopolyspora saharensis]|uniref:hypothetical protein n=1 Tax=Actinopolyspora saharensis TaxID=995062 RepID=UPI000A79E148|nr:hypothetical protein [Actinopolyspora saharensis]
MPAAGSAVFGPVASAAFERISPTTVLGSLLRSETQHGENPNVVKPVGNWETIVWGSAAVMLVCAVIIAVVQNDPSGTLGILLAAAAMLFAAAGQRRRTRQRSTHS